MNVVNVHVIHVISIQPEIREFTFFTTLHHLQCLSRNFLRHLQHFLIYITYSIMGRLQRPTTIRQLKRDRLYALRGSGESPPARADVGRNAEPQEFSMSTLPALTTTRLSQVYVATVNQYQDRINLAVRIKSPILTTACRQAGLPIELAELCGGLLASVTDDLQQIGLMRRTDIMRTKRKQRVLAAADEPYASALRIAIAASPVNGRAAVAHWDAICEGYELGKLAWLLGLDTETSWGYGRRMERRDRQ
jgi:hypothetical protein